MASDHMAAAVRASETTHEYFDGELPSVDDLEVAAAAAMADVAPEPLPATTSDDFMDDGDSDSDAAFSGPGRSALDEMEAGDEQHGRPVTAQLVVVGDAVRLRLAVQKISYGARIGTMAAGTARMGIVDIRQRPAVGPLVISDSDMSSDSDKELLEVDVLADIRARLDEPVDEDAEDKAAFTSSVMDELPSVEPLDVEIAANDELLPAGRVASVLEAVIIVQVSELGRVFDEGTVLCLEDRTPLGRVTEVFGPVQAPLYALRYSGSSGAPPEIVAAGTHVCAVARYALALEPEIVQQQAPIVEEEIEQDDPSFQFSDDEQEAEYQRQVARRPAAPAIQAEAHSSFEHSRQQSTLGGRGWDAGSGSGRGGFAKRQGGRGRGGRHALPQGLHPSAAGQHLPPGASPGLQQWPGQTQRQGWTPLPPQQPAFSSPPAAFGSPVQFGGVQQLPNGSFLLPIAQQVVLTPQQMQQLQQTGAFPGQLAPFLAQGLPPPSPSGVQHFSPHFAPQQYPSQQYAGPPTAMLNHAPQVFQQQVSRQQTQQVRAPATAPQSSPQPPRPPMPPLYRTGI